MSTTGDDRATAVAMANEGLATLSELAELAGTSRQLVRYWCKVEGIDVSGIQRKLANERATLLRREWRKRMG